ncbi:hypothetical protein F2Q68_00006792 [Brassica cretica]|uniref:F-box associated domain-containing protein n=1 Tax=Brassica cretica TaxID=69181 RepID=A0A8S9JBB2_BRACR|nr:hypothetical protein F2Q68_00006792 [Brassica cretica]
MRTIPDVHLHIWSMVDVEEAKWVKMHSICLCRLYNRRLSNPQLFTPVVVSKQGDGVVFKCPATELNRLFCGPQKCNVKVWWPTGIELQVHRIGVHSFRSSLQALIFFFFF